MAVYTEASNDTAVVDATSSVVGSLVGWTIRTWSERGLFTKIIISLVFTHVLYRSLFIPKTRKVMTWTAGIDITLTEIAIFAGGWPLKLRY